MIPYTATASCESLVQTNDSIMVIDYIHPALEGTTVTLSCPPGLVLFGPNSTTCMDNGQWEPDPRDSMECKGIDIYL